MKGIIRTVPEEGGFYSPPAKVEVTSRHKTPVHDFHRFCPCGVLAWDVEHERQQPAIGRPVVCWNCGIDNRRPDLGSWLPDAPPKPSPWGRLVQFFQRVIRWP